MDDPAAAHEQHPFLAQGAQQPAQLEHLPGRPGHGQGHLDDRDRSLREGGPQGHPGAMVQGAEWIQVRFQAPSPDDGGHPGGQGRGPRGGIAHPVERLREAAEVM